MDGSGNVVEIPENGCRGIGSGGIYAESAVRGIMAYEKNQEIDVKHIAKIAMKVAADTCVYTSHEWV